MFQGLIDLQWWGYVLATLALTHITIASVTIYLHRQQAHRALDLHPVASHFFRFFTTDTPALLMGTSLAPASFAALSIFTAI